MTEVRATVGDLLILTGQCATGFGSVRAALLAPRQSAGGALDPAFGFSEEARVFNHMTVGVGGETIKAHINTDRRFSFYHGLRLIKKVELYDQRDIPFARRLALECCAFQRQINCLRLPDRHPADLRN